MRNYYFTYRPNHKNYGGWIRVISETWQTAMSEYQDIYGRDYLSFCEEEFIIKSAFPRGELQII